MHQHSVFKLVHSFLICGLLPLTGCRHLSNENQTGDELDSGFAQMLKPAFFDLPHNTRVAFNYLHDEVSLADRHAISPTNNGVYYSMFFTILSAPVVERPEFWAEIVNDPSRDELVRWNCLQALVLRHLKPGDPITKAPSIFGSDEWFGENQFESASTLNVIPLERREGELAVVLTPNLQPAGELNVSARWIFFSVKRLEKHQEFTVEDVRSAILGKGPKRKFVFTQISVW